MATCKHCNKPLILKKGKCIYCGQAPEDTPQPAPSKQPAIRKSKPIKQRRSFENQQKSIQDLIIKVTSPCFDNIGQILDQLEIKYLPFDRDYNCNILFLNCGTSDMIDYDRLRSFVQNGGILYASDLTSSHIISAWPDIMTVRNDTIVCNIKASIEDSDLRQYLGDSIDIEFDLSGWSQIVSTTQGKVLMRSIQQQFPIMMEFTIGQGKVFYTSFHNHAQAKEAEEKLLRLLVIKQLSFATKQSFHQTIQSFPTSF